MTREQAQDLKDYVGFGTTIILMFLAMVWSSAGYPLPQISTGSPGRLKESGRRTTLSINSSCITGSKVSKTPAHTLARGRRTTAQHTGLVVPRDGSLVSNTPNGSLAHSQIAPQSANGITPTTPDLSTSSGSVDSTMSSRTNQRNAAPFKDARNRTMREGFASVITGIIGPWGNRLRPRAQVHPPNGSTGLRGDSPREKDNEVGHMHVSPFGNNQVLLRPRKPAELDIESEAADLLAWADSQGIRATITSMHRTREEQTELWRNRHSNSYPVAPPGHSMHEKGRAFDLSASPKELEQLGQEWERRGGTWGGDFNDPIHFEK